MSEQQAFAYIGKKPCGCIVAAVVDLAERKETTAQHVAEMIADGLTVERVTCEYVRQNMRRCTCGQAQQLTLGEVTA